ncbi:MULTISPECIES: NlpC/P60 family protein [Streptomyces]|uniref:Glycoside hydrolase n=2 Tax=Streptomyces TaxID=1883 RepID=A0A3R7HTN4_9ACTN|nr:MULTISPECIES: NlpC/P60 family protein [Streptomyces]KNE79166.1 glycoside hydrolase [Streptomyces fradiae]OFA49657.1 glycoside hydrolase [Streptomyces fradiae]PQM19827.1 glycoside hydrolase [Streptomyces xinghaiensis]RKM90892.1 glycoside hydrolase [Streptomyces xinghaiensis]RNC68792.1 glycoside hydrolase [Streptomyces xinghaiensis]
MGRQRTIVTATALVCAVGGLLTPGAALAAPNDPEPVPASRLEEIRKEIETLYRKAEAATEAYNAAREKTGEQSRKLARIEKKSAAAEKRMKLLRSQAGAMVRSHYRGAAMPDTLKLLLEGGSGDFLHDADTARKGRQAQQGLMKSLENTRERLDEYADTADQEYRRLRAQQKKKAVAKKAVETRIEAAEELESRLQAEELEKLRELEAEAARKAQAAWLDSGVLEEIDARASAEGKKAIAYATGQLGKDYEWGAEGPDTYDCSGLTSQAWAAAGRTIPRTSQEQWKRLPRIAVRDMRPGDLIIYHSDASHVGMYIGDGDIVHAPRPGRQITVTGAGSMRILGVVRPDERVGERTGEQAGE